MLTLLFKGYGAKVGLGNMRVKAENRMLTIGMLKLNYFLADIFILSAEKQPIKLSWRKIEWLHYVQGSVK